MPRKRTIGILVITDAEKKDARMDENYYWWVNEEYYPFLPGMDGYPCPEEVIWYYRKQKIVNGIPWTQADLAKALDISEKSAWSMENHNGGLNSFDRRAKLVNILNIPPVLLKLDACSLSSNQQAQRPGQVIKEYRIKKKKDDGSSWTQKDLATLLKISEKSVRSMENHDVGLDSLARRELLITILDIPPTLMGLDELHLFEKPPLAKPAKPRLATHITLNQQKLTRYQMSIPSIWEAQYSGSVSLKAVEKVIHDLRNRVAYVTVSQQERIRELLYHYHQLALDIARDQGDLETALAHADLSITLAQKLENKEFLAAALYRRGLTHFDRGNFPAAACDLGDALPLASHVRSQLKGMVYMEAGRFHAYIAQSNIDKLHARKLLDQTELIVRRDQLENDGSYVKLDSGRYHIGKAATLIVLQHPEEALEELDLADRLTKPEHLRRHAYIDILRARAYFAQGEFSSATDLAFDALRTCLAIHSESNIVDIEKLHSLLSQTSFGNSLAVVQLGLMLRSRK